MDLNLSVAGDGQTLTATVVDVTYFTEDHRVGNTPVDAVPKLGDTFRLEFVYPDLLLATTLHAFDPSRPNALGNPYRCGEEVAREVSYACGA